MSTFPLTLKSFICRIKFVKSIETFLYLHGLISASIWVLRVLGFFRKIALLSEWSTVIITSKFS